MKTFMTVAVAATLFATPVMAQTRAADRSADALNAQSLEVIRAREVPPLTPTELAPATPASNHPRIYAGLGVGYGGTDLANGTWSNQLTVGYNVTNYLALEAVAGLYYGDATASASNGQTLVANALVGYDFGPVRPYALIGAGGGFDGMGNNNSNPDGIWNYGAGLAVNIDQTWQIDARFTRVEGFRIEREPADRFTVGVNYRF